VLIRVGEFIYLVDFVVIETKKVSNIAREVPVILGHLFLATANVLITCRNGIIRLSFDNMTLELNIFSMQRQPSGFDDMEFSTLNWIGESVFDDVFATKYESFLIDNEPEYDVFEFDDLCSTTNFLRTPISESVSESISPLALELKPLHESLKSMMASDLD